MKPETLALHAGFNGDPTTNAATTPIYQTTSYTFDDTQHGADLFDLKVQGNIYTRIMNPTNAVLEERMAQLEGGVGALAVASGMAAILYSLQTICKVGNNIVSTGQLYGGTYNLFAHSLPNQGINCRMVRHDDFDAVEKLILGRGGHSHARTTPAANLVEALEASKQQPWHRQLYGLGIRHIGEVNAKALAAAFFSIDSLAAAALEAPEQIA